MSKGEVRQAGRFPCCKVSHRELESRVGWVTTYSFLTKPNSFSFLVAPFFSAIRFYYFSFIPFVLCPYFWSILLSASWMLPLFMAGDACRLPLPPPSFRFLFLRLFAFFTWTLRACRLVLFAMWRLQVTKLLRCTLIYRTLSLHFISSWWSGFSTRTLLWSSAMLFSLCLPVCSSVS